MAKSAQKLRFVILLLCLFLGLLITCESFPWQAREWNYAGKYGPAEPSQQDAGSAGFPDSRVHISPPSPPTQLEAATRKFITQEDTLLLELPDSGTLTKLTTKPFVRLADSARRFRGKDSLSLLDLKAMPTPDPWLMQGASITYTQADILRLGARTLYDLARITPGFVELASTEGRTVSARGVGGERPQPAIFLDGQLLNDLLTGTVNWEGLPLYAAQSVTFSALPNPRLGPKDQGIILIKTLGKASTQNHHELRGNLLPGAAPAGSYQGQIMLPKGRLVGGLQWRQDRIFARPTPELETVPWRLPDYAEPKTTWARSSTTWNGQVAWVAPWGELAYYQKQHTLDYLRKANYAGVLPEGDPSGQRKEQFYAVMANFYLLKQAGRTWNLRLAGIQQQQTARKYLYSAAEDSLGFEPSLWQAPWPSDSALSGKHRRFTYRQAQEQRFFVNTKWTQGYRPLHASSDWQAKWDVQAVYVAFRYAYQAQEGTQTVVRYVDTGVERTEEQTYLATPWSLQRQGAVVFVNASSTFQRGDFSSQLGARLQTVNLPIGSENREWRSQPMWQPWLQIQKVLRPDQSLWLHYSYTHLAPPDSVPLPGMWQPQPDKAPYLRHTVQLQWAGLTPSQGRFRLGGYVQAYRNPTSPDRFVHLAGLDTQLFPTLGSGNLTMAGLEGYLSADFFPQQDSLQRPRLHTFVHASLSRAIGPLTDSSFLQQGELMNYPTLTATGHLAYTWSAVGQAHSPGGALALTGTYRSATPYPLSDTVAALVPHWENPEVPGFLELNATAQFRWKLPQRKDLSSATPAPGLTLQVSVYNLLGYSERLPGYTALPQLGPGRHGEVLVRINF
ncbi:MAG: TonB-dependent receptor [Bacteroidota bacterium]